MPPACAGDHAKSRWGYLTGDVGQCKMRTLAYRSMAIFFGIFIVIFGIIEFIGIRSFLLSIFRSGDTLATICFLIGAFGFILCALTSIAQFSKKKVGPTMSLMVLMAFMPTVTSLPFLGIPFVDVYVFFSAFCAIASAVFIGMVWCGLVVYRHRVNIRAWKTKERCPTGRSS